jgi:hypothetical protein
MLLHSQASYPRRWFGLLGVFLGAAEAMLTFSLSRGMSSGSRVQLFCQGWLFSFLIIAHLLLPRLCSPPVPVPSPAGSFTPPPAVFCSDLSSLV